MASVGELFQFYDVLSRNNFKPWWESYHDFSLVAMILTSLYMAFTVQPEDHFFCRPEGNQTTTLSSDDIQYSAAVCFGQFAWNWWIHAYTGTLSLVASLLVYMSATFWPALPNVVRLFTEVRKADKKMLDSEVGTKEVAEMLVKVEIDQDEDDTMRTKMKTISEVRELLWSLRGKVDALSLYILKILLSSALLCLSVMIPVFMFLNKDIRFNCDIQIGEFDGLVCQSFIFEKVFLYLGVYFFCAAFQLAVQICNLCFFFIQRPPKSNLDLVSHFSRNSSVLHASTSFIISHTQEEIDDAANKQRSSTVLTKMLPTVLDYSTQQEELQKPLELFQKRAGTSHPVSMRKLQNTRMQETRPIPPSNTFEYEPIPRDALSLAPMAPEPSRIQEECSVSVPFCTPKRQPITDSYRHSSTTSESAVCQSINDKEPECTDRLLSTPSPQSPHLGCADSHDREKCLSISSSKGSMQQRSHFTKQKRHAPEDNEVCGKACDDVEMVETDKKDRTTLLAVEKVHIPVRKQGKDIPFKTRPMHTLSLEDLSHAQIVTTEEISDPHPSHMMQQSLESHPEQSSLTTNHSLEVNHAQEKAPEIKTIPKTPEKTLSVSSKGSMQQSSHVTKRGHVPEDYAVSSEDCDDVFHLEMPEAEKEDDNALLDVEAEKASIHDTENPSGTKEKAAMHSSDRSYAAQASGQDVVASEPESLTPLIPVKSIRNVTFPREPFILDEEIAPAKTTRHTDARNSRLSSTKSTKVSSRLANQGFVSGNSHPVRSTRRSRGRSGNYVSQASGNEDSTQESPRLHQFRQRCRNALADKNYEKFVDYHVDFFKQNKSQAIAAFTSLTWKIDFYDTDLDERTLLFHLLKERWFRKIPAPVVDVILKQIPTGLENSKIVSDGMAWRSVSDFLKDENPALKKELERKSGNLGNRGSGFQEHAV